MSAPRHPGAARAHLCADCAHLQPPAAAFGYPAPLRPHDAVCTAPQIGFSLVTGAPLTMLCVDMRDKGGACGLDGALFSIRPSSAARKVCP